jgi:hypothetical protein
VSDLHCDFIKRLRLLAARLLVAGQREGQVIWDELRARDFVYDPSVRATVESDLAAGAVVNSYLKEIP